MHQPQVIVTADPFLVTAGSPARCIAPPLPVAREAGLDLPAGGSADFTEQASG